MIPVNNAEVMAQFGHLWDDQQWKCKLRMIPGRVALAELVQLLHITATIQPGMGRVPHGLVSPKSHSHLGASGNLGVIFSVSLHSSGSDSGTEIVENSWNSSLGKAKIVELQSGEGNSPWSSSTGRFPGV